MGRTTADLHWHHHRSSGTYMFSSQILTTSQIGVRDPTLILRNSIYYCEIENLDLFVSFSHSPYKRID
jgi:hypothetical protein